MYSKENWIEMIREWIQIGVEMIGGCCKTNPEHIRLIKSIIEELQVHQH